MALWKNDFITINKYTRPSIKLKAIKKIVLHWTANPGASAENHQRYFNGTAIKNKTYASAHIFVDPNEAICIIPFDEVAYHANDQYERNSRGEVFRGVPELAPNANLLSVGVEMCVERDGSISSATIKRAATVIAALCKAYKLDENDIVRHYDVTHKLCPKPFVDDPEKFNDFKAQVRAILNPPKKPISTSQKDSIPYKGILKEGSRGATIKKVQQKLKITADGIFGPNTEKAVKNFQVKNGLAADGIVGPKTWSKLF
ncbi:peptidoglycan recognition protein family protein [Gottfriedia solisilvae]|uniref:peptidoglycan recognition protein family protein n=1 Tax=Gottfriedia solisilvae TaxID=1516104 RepID=UPI003D2EA290